MSNQRRFRQFVSVYALIAGSGLTLNSAHAGSDDVAYDELCRALTLEEGSVSETLEKISIQSGVSIVVDHRLIEGLHAPAVSGAMDCLTTLQDVLVNADLNVQKLSGSTLVISKSPKPTERIREAKIRPILEAASMQDVITVTSTRLFANDLYTTSPVMTISRNEFNARGASRVEDFVNILPAAFASQNTNIGNGSTGASSLNLRNLGAVRTLVLIDGRRLPYGTPSSASANLDLIAPQLVELVDIVTGGASAVYGSDAIAGVANFRLRRDFEGIELDGQVGAYQDSNNNSFSNALLGLNNISAPGSVLDGRNVTASLLIGANGANDRSNVTAFFGYQDQNEIRQDARDYSTCAFGPAAAGPRTIGGIGCSGSSTFRRFFTPGGDFFLEDDGTFVPFTGAPEQRFNYAPDNFIQRPVERFNASAFARYDITDSLSAFLDLSYTNNHTDSQVASSGSFFRPFLVNCDNPFLVSPVPSGESFANALGCSASAIADGTVVPLASGYRNVTGDARNSAHDFEVFRTVGSLRGTIDGRWSWEAFGQFSRTTTVSIFSGDVNFSKLQDAFFVVDNGAGPVCLSGNPNCIPYNIFQRNASNQSLVTRAAAQSVQGTGVRNGNTELKEVGATIQGDLGIYGVRFPLAASGVKMLIGSEWREDSLVSKLDIDSQTSGAVTGINGARLPVSGSVKLWELFMESQIPLIEEKRFFEELRLNAAYRFSRYTTENNDLQSKFSAHTYSAGMSWVPFPGVRVRGQFQRAVRAPNVIELFTGLTTGVFSNSPGPNGLYDPCAGDFDETTHIPAPAATFEQCANTGVIPAQYGAIPDSVSNQLNSIRGGNSQLTPEKADTYTAGIVLTPSFFKNFSLSVDYFDITVKEAISSVSPNLTLERCLATAYSDYCSLITRDQFGSLFLDSTTESGHLTGISSANVNIGNLVTRGLDFAVAYKVDLAELGLDGWGTLDWGLASTYSLENSFALTPELSRRQDCSGFFANECVGPNPKYQQRLLTTWTTPWDLDFSVTWRYLSHVKNAYLRGYEDARIGNILDDRLDAAHYVDIGVQWYMRDNVTFRAGMQNLLSRDPEFQTTVGNSILSNGNTLPGTYDPTGRFLFFGINIRG